MGADPFNDTSTAVDEPGWGGGGACIDVTGNFTHLPPSQRYAAKDRKKIKDAHWRAAQEVRETWSKAQFDAEEARLRAEVEAILEARNAV